MPLPDNMSILEVINKAVTEKTFSLEAVKAITQLKDDYTTEVSNHKNTTEVLKEQRGRTTTLQNKVGAMETTLKAYASAEDSLKEREKKQLRLEIENEQLKLRLADHKDMMLSLTRNLEYRNSVYGNKDVIDQNGYTSGTMQNHSSTDTQTTE